ncbi:hypothetical protein ABPG72_008965 [Tetrahymena utriculariae]
MSTSTDNADNQDKKHSQINQVQCDREGKQIHSDFSIYQGYWHNDLKNGYGKFIYTYGIYEGYMMNCIRCGKGKEICSVNGNIQGYFDFDLYHGHGIYTWFYVASFEGKFKNGKQDGHGFHKMDN